MRARRSLSEPLNLLLHYRVPTHWSDISQDISSKVSLPGPRRAVAAMLKNHILGFEVCHHQTPILDRFI
jgi:hypothetical protein